MTGELNPQTSKTKDELCGFDLFIYADNIDSVNTSLHNIKRNTTRDKQLRLRPCERWVQERCW